MLRDYEEVMLLFRKVESKLIDRLSAVYEDQILPFYHLPRPLSLMSVIIPITNDGLYLALHAPSHTATPPASLYTG